MRPLLLGAINKGPATCPRWLLYVLNRPAKGIELTANAMNIAVTTSEQATTGPNPYRVNSLLLDGTEQPVEGSVVWEPRHSLWNGGMLLAAVILGPIYFSWGGVLVFLGLSAVTLCAGHSVGYHRRLIHRSFQCSKTVERVLVWLGAMVGWVVPYGRSAPMTRGTGRSANRAATTITRIGTAGSAICGETCTAG